VGLSLRALHAQQHPPRAECRGRRLLLVQNPARHFEGLASSMNQVVVGLAQAAHGNRTLIWGLSLPYLFDRTRPLWEVAVDGASAGPVSAAARGLPRPEDVIALAQQRFDLAAGRLGAALEKNTFAHERDLVRTLSRFGPSLLARPNARRLERVRELFARTRPAALRGIDRAAERLTSLDKLRQSLNPERPLELGFALVRKADGSIARSAAALDSGEAVTLKFKIGERGAVIDGTVGAAASPAPIPPKPRPAPKPGSPSGQGDLF
jgi:hypothetical protein